MGTCLLSFEVKNLATMRPVQRLTLRHLMLAKTTASDKTKIRKILARDLGEALQVVVHRSSEEAISSGRMATNRKKMMMQKGRWIDHTKSSERER